MNAKIVVIKGPWWKETLSHLTFLFPYSSLFPSQRSSYHVVPATTASARKRANSSARRLLHTDDEVDVTVEEDLAPGGDYIKLLLLPKPFSPDFRENWELYRSEYWEKENERRASLLRRIRQQERQKARELGGWLWWTGWRGWRRSRHASSRKEVDVEKTHHRHFSEKDARMRLGGKRTDSSHSRNSSRSSTPTVEGDERPSVHRLRRGSSSSSQHESRRRVKGGSSLGNELQISKLSEGQAPMKSLLTRVDSGLSLSSGNESDRSAG